jgi:hypothetical protein
VKEFVRNFKKVRTGGSSEQEEGSTPTNGALIGTTTISEGVLTHPLDIIIDCRFH